LSEVRKGGPWRIALVLVLVLPFFAGVLWVLIQDPWAQGATGKPYIILFPVAVVCLIVYIVQMAKKSK